MKIMNAVKESFKKEKGSLIVEATIAFPVMFLIVIFLIFLGNIYYQKEQSSSSLYERSYRVCRERIQSYAEVSIWIVAALEQ